MQAVLPRVIRLPSTYRRSFVCRAMAQAPLFDIAVKGDPKNNILGDCPFCHRALLTLEEKSVPYQKTYIDFSAKPQWLLDANPSGTVPVMKDLETGEWIPDSGVISDMLESRFPEPSLGTLDSSPQVGMGIFTAFKEYGNSSHEEAAAKEAELQKQLQELEDYLSKSGGPYIGGQSPCATDASLMPKLYHMVVALKHFRGWELPAAFNEIHKYMNTFMERDSWKNTHYAPELVIKGWERHGFQVKK